MAKGDPLLENWRTEQRADGVYVIVEEIGGLGSLGPFPDLDAARVGLARHLMGTPEPAGGRDTLPGERPALRLPPAPDL